MSPPPEPGEPRPSPIAAMDRVQTPRDAGGGPTRPVWRPLAFVALLVTGVVIAWGVVRGDEVPNSDNILVHFVEAAGTFASDVATTRPADAEAYVLETLGWSVPPPDLPGLALVGVGITPVGTVPGAASAAASDVVVPGYRYEDDRGAAAFVFAYDYIVLDQVGDAFDLPEATYSVLAEPTPVDTRRLAEAYLVTWRRRGIIFTAVTTDESLFERIGQAVAS